MEMSGQKGEQETLMVLVSLWNSKPWDGSSTQARQEEGSEATVSCGTHATAGEMEEDSGTPQPEEGSHAGLGHHIYFLAGCHGG